MARGAADHLGGPGDGEAKIDDLLLAGCEHGGPQALNDVIGPPVQGSHGVEQNRPAMNGLGEKRSVGHGARPLQISAAVAGFGQVLRSIP